MYVVIYTTCSYITACTMSTALSFEIRIYIILLSGDQHNLSKKTFELLFCRIILNTDGTRAGCAVVCEAQLVPVSSQLTETVEFNVYILCQFMCGIYLIPNIFNYWVSLNISCLRTQTIGFSCRTCKRIGKKSLTLPLKAKLHV